MPNTILDRLRIAERVYALVPVGRPVTFQSQQLRAFNLVWALYATELIRSDARVAVIGGGLAGITAATAAYLKGCQVSLFERLAGPMLLQRKNQSRYIHPNMHRWPQNDLHERSDLPALNWYSSSAGVVVDQVDYQWEAICLEAGRRIKSFYRFDVELVLDGPHPKIRAQRRRQAENDTRDTVPNLVFEEFDVVILTVGFGSERCIADVPFTSYWENDSFDQARRDAEDRHRVLISGCGDGGLIDAQRFCIQNFNHERFVDELLYHSKYKPLRDAVIKIEKRLSRIRDDVDFQLRAFRLYRELAESGNPGWISFNTDFGQVGTGERNLRDDVAVTLNSEGVTPFSRNASALNRFITYVLLAKRALRYEQGSIQASLSKGKYDVVFSDGVCRQYDQLIVRHGPEGALAKLVPQDQIEHMKKIWRNTVGDPTVEPRWPQNFYPASIATTAPPTLDRAMKLFPGAFRKLYDSKSVRSICVGDHKGREGYIVRLKDWADTPQGDRYYGEIPIFYRGGNRRASTSDELTINKTIVAIGSGVLNAGQPHDIGKSNEIDSAPRGRYRGTLGMFLTGYDSDDLYFLSTATALARNPRTGSSFEAASRNDAILSEVDEQKTFATLRDSYVPPSSRKSTSRRDAPAEGFPYDYALARITARNPRKYSFNDQESPFYPLLNVPNFQLPNQTRGPKTGDLVYKIGRTSGITWGYVTKLDAIVRAVYSHEKPVVFNHVFAIEAAAGDRTSGNAPTSQMPFSAPGDSGAVVFTIDGYAIGLLFADGGGVSYASSIEKILDEVECEPDFNTSSIEI
jgi:hypothetical protein